MKFDPQASVTRAEAVQQIKENWTPAAKTEVIPLEAALGRVTAEDLRSVNTLPVVRASCFDGIAVRSADFQGGLPDTSSWVRGRDFVRADTGDDFPDCFDTVIAMEDIVFSGDTVRFREGFAYDPTEETVDPAGTIVARDALLVPSRTRLAPEHLAALAMGGVAELPVLRRPRVVFIPTGSELTDFRSRPERGQNVESNGIMLSAMLSQWGADCHRSPIVPDKEELLARALDSALETADIVLINGGSSRGEEDWCSELIRSRSHFFRHGVKAVPGRPVGMAVIEGKPVINVPGPVIAAYLAAHWLLSALVQHYYGLPAPVYPKVTAVLTAPVKKRAGFELIARVHLQRSESGYTALPLSWGDGGIPELLRQTDGFLNVPAEVSGLEAGHEVEIELLKDPTYIAGP